MFIDGVFCAGCGSAGPSFPCSPLMRSRFGERNHPVGRHSTSPLPDLQSHWPGLGLTSPWAPKENSVHGTKNVYDARMPITCHTSPPLIPNPDRRVGMPGLGLGRGDNCMDLESHIRHAPCRTPAFSQFQAVSALLAHCAHCHGSDTRFFDVFDVIHQRKPVSVSNAVICDIS